MRGIKVSAYWLKTKFRFPVQCWVLAWLSLLTGCTENADREQGSSVENDFPKFQHIKFLKGEVMDSFITDFRQNPLTERRLNWNQQKVTLKREHNFNWTFLGLNPENNRELSFSNLPFQTTTKNLVNPVIQTITNLSPLKASIPGMLHISLPQGLPGTSVNALIRDAAGRLWIGTDNGLAIYDGLKLTVFTVENGLPSNYISCICRLKDDRMAIGTKEGLLLTDGIDATYLNSKSGLSSNWIRSLCTMGDWLVSGTSKGIDLIGSNQLIKINFPCTIHTVLAGGANRFFASTEKDGLISVQLNPDGNMQMKTMASQNTEAIALDGDSTLLAGLSSGGILKFAGDSIYQATSAHTKFQSIRCKSAVKINDAELAWSLTSGGMLFMNFNENKIVTYNSKDGIPLIENNMIIASENGSITMGGVGGICHIPEIKNQQFLEGHTPFPGPIPFGINYSKSDSTLWMSFYDRGVAKLSRNVLSTANEKAGISCNTSFNFAFSGKNTFSATSGKGLDILLEQKVLNISNQQGLSSSYVNTVLTSRNGSTYLGTDDAGLFKIRNDSLFRIIKKNGSFPTSIYSLYEDRDGGICVGTNGSGLFILKGSTFLKPEIDENSEIKVIYAIKRWLNHLVLGTYGQGIYLLKSDSIARISQKNGLPNESIYGFETTKDSSLICGTGKGNSILRKIGEKLLLRNLNSQNLSAFEDCNPYASAMDGENLWIGAGNSLLKLKTDFLVRKINPLPSIQSIRFGRFDSLLLSSHGKLKKSGSGAIEPFLPEIPYSENNVSISLGHKNYDFPQDRIQYQVKLMPIQTNWSSFNSVDGIKSFERLAAGEYTFRFRVRETGMEWSKVQEISFRILPPWWETWWFRLLEGSAGILLIFGIVQFRTRSLKREKVKLEGIVQERTAEVVEQKEIIEHKNRNIIQSMEYASRIQRNILPPVSELKTMIPESFILYQPKDIVSGDFYWFHPLPEDSPDQPGAFGESVLIAACDCTGHGIPGAMVSVVCRGALQKAVRELKLKKPAEILAEASKVVAQELGKITNTDADIPDGMDVSMIRLDLKNRQVQWAGAHNPLWILRKGEILETKGDNVSIGSRNEAIDLNGHEISLETGDFLFMFSDGFADQFGGPKEKKLTKQGFKNMLISLENEPAGIFREKLLAAHLEWKGQCPQVDDICVIGIKI